MRTLLTILLFCLLPALAGAAEIVSGPWLQDPRSESIRVLWEMDAFGEEARVEFGLDAGYGQVVVAEERLVQYHIPAYVARLDGLAPGQIYHYRVTVDGVSSPDATFRAAPPAGEGGFRFYVIGDTRSAPERWGGIAQLILADIRDWPAHNQSFGVCVGDIVYNGIVADEYREMWFLPARELLAELPVHVAFGNHEDRNDLHRSDALLSGLFDSPYLASGSSDEKWYALRYGSVDMTVLALWDDAGIAEGPQRDWLERHLAPGSAARQARWRFATLHLLPWSFGHHGPDDEPSPALQAVVHPLLHAASVTAAFGGHNHLYARYAPIDGVHYLTTGSSGTPTLLPADAAAWPGGELRARSGVIHYAAVDVTEESVSIRVIDEEGERIDYVTVGPNAANRPPLADAGSSVCRPLGPRAHLDGRASVDPESSPLVYEWVQVDGPARVELQGADTAQPWFVPRVSGEYVFTLRVGDGEQWSAPDFVRLSVVPRVAASPPRLVQPEPLLSREDYGTPGGPFETPMEDVPIVAPACDVLSDPYAPGIPVLLVLLAALFLRRWAWPR